MITVFSIHPLTKSRILVIEHFGCISTYCFNDNVRALPPVVLNGHASVVLMEYPRTADGKNTSPNLPFQVVFEQNASILG